VWVLALIKIILKKHLKAFIYVYERLKCKRALNYLIGLKMELNTVYNTKYKISIKEYIHYLTILVVIS